MAELEEWGGICLGQGLRDVECGGLNAVSRRFSLSPYGLSCVELSKLTCGEYEEEGCCGNWGKGSRRRGFFGGKRYLSLSWLSTNRWSFSVPGLRLPLHFSDNRTVTRKANSTGR
jgi:hypothetical protein